MRHARSMTVTAVVAVVALIVLSADDVVGPPDPPPRPVARMGSGGPVAGSSTCSVGFGPAATAFDLPELEADLDEDPDELLDDADDQDEPAEPDAPEDAGDPGDEGAAAPDDDGGVPAGDVGATAGGSPTLITARPDRTGAGPASLDLAELVDGQRTVTELPDVFPSADVRATPDAMDDLGAVQVQWRGGPAVTTREWRLEGDDLPEAIVAGPCAQASAEPHMIPGMSTVGGDEARLRLINPFESAASVAVAFVTPTGREEPVALRNLSVPARSVREVPVNQTLPERDDLAAVVEVASGRVAVEGLQVSRAAIGGIDGATLLRATTEPAEEWTVAWVVDDVDGIADDPEDDPAEEDVAEEDVADDADDAAGAGADAATSWLWILNPSERTASVGLTLHTEDGGEVPAGLAEVSVGPDELRRIDLSGTFPEGVGQAAITARSNGVPIVVSGVAQIGADDPARSGRAVQLGALPDDEWVVSAVREGEREEQLRLVNPGSEPAVVDVRLFNGVATVRPGHLQAVSVPAGSTRSLELGEDLGDTARWSAFVTTSQGEIVVGRVGRDVEGPLRLTALPGAPSASWAAFDSGLTAVFGDGLSRRLGTGLGLDTRPAEVGDDDDGHPPGFGDPQDQTSSDPDPDSDPDPGSEPEGDS